MKHALLGFFVLLPALASAYPDPNVTNGQSAGEIVDSILSQPATGPLIATAPVGS